MMVRKAGKIRKTGFAAVILAAAAMVFGTGAAEIQRSENEVRLEKDFDNEATAKEEAPELTGRSEEQAQATAGAGRKADSSGIVTELIYGFRNVAVSGRHLPVTLTITNTKDKNLNGSVRLSARSPEGTVAARIFSVSVGAGSTETLQTVLTISDHAEAIKAEVFDSGDVLLTENTCPVSILGEGSELLIGLLSDRPQELGYFRGISVAKSALRTRTVILDPSDIPTTPGGLRQLDILVISDFDLTRLSGDAVHAIEEMVRAGGCLLIGTGDRIGSFGEMEKLLEGTTLSEPCPAVINMGMQYSVNGPDGAVLVLKVRDVRMPGGRAKMESSEVQVLTTVDEGMGVIGIMAFDLCDINDFCKDQIAYTDDLLQNLMGTARLRAKTAQGSRGISATAAIRSILDVQSSENAPKTGMYLMIGVGYILLAGLLLWVCLRIKGLEIYYPFGLLVCAALVSALVWMCGTATRVNAPFMRYAAIRDAGETGSTEYLYVLAAAPDNNPLELTVKENYEIRPILEDGTGEGYGTGVITVNEKGSKSRVTVEGFPPFKSSIFEVIQKERPDSETYITSDISLFGGEAAGTVTNVSSTDLSCAAVLTQGSLIHIGDLKAGETRELSGADVINIPIGSGDLVSDYVSGLNSMDPGDSRYGDRLRLKRLLCYYIDNELSGIGYEARLTACFNRKGKPEALMDNGAACEGTTLLSTPVHVSRKRFEYTERNLLEKTPRVMSGQYDESTNTTSGSAAVVLTYDIGSDMEVSHLSFTTLDSAMSGGLEQGQQLRAFAGATGIYNYAKGSFDLLNQGTERLEARELKACLSPDNTVTVRYIPDENYSAGGRVMLPVPVVTGIEKEKEKTDAEAGPR